MTSCISVARKKKPEAPYDPVSDYAQGVIAGLVPAGRLVVLACQRHLGDLETAEERGLVWSLDHAMHAIEFYGFLRHYKGEWAGQVIALEPWQQFIIGCVFGWLRQDGFRRYRTAYCEVPRKNGKSTIAGGVGLYMFVADGEGGAEVYSAATKRDQAKIVFEAAKQMVAASPELARRIVRNKYNLNHPPSSSIFEPLPADDKKLDGLGPHCSILDELHAHPNRDLVDVIDTAMGARSQPLMFEITTAGSDRQSICWEHHDYSEKVLEGVFDDESADSWFAYIAAADEGDDWEAEETWAKANPNFGISVKPDDLLRQALAAKARPAALGTFLQKRLNVWTQVADRWLSIESWDACAASIDESELLGRKCYAGLDLARVRDLSALALWFPPEGNDEFWRLLVRYWVPEMDIEARTRTDRVPYETWQRDGWLVATSGNTTDHDFIEAEIVKTAGMFDLQEVAYDRTFAHQMVNHLIDEGVTMVPFGQGFFSMASPTAEFERMVVAGELRHEGNPVTNWNASNVVVRTDPAGGIKPDKERSREKVDGIVAAIMGLGRAQVHGGSDSGNLDDFLARPVMVV